MWKKLLIVSLSIAVLFVFTAPISSVNAGDKSKNVNWRIVGTIVQLIDINKPTPTPPFFESVGMHSLINLTAYGSPGPAKLTLLSTTTVINPCTSGECFICPDGYNAFQVYFEKDDMVAVFPDHSLLFTSIDPDQYGILCFDVGFNTYFKVKMNVTRGTGRFEGATGGDVIGEGYGYPANFDSTLAGEHGTIKGTIEFD